MITRAKQSMRTIIWAVRMAAEINKKAFIGWLLLTGLLSILPAVSLEVLQKILRDLDILSTNYNIVFKEIGLLGLIMIAIGVSSRLNTDLLYMVMYDSYYLGMMERIIDFTQVVDVEALMDKNLRDEYTIATLRSGALNDFISAFCALIGKAISITAMLIFVVRVSPAVFGLSSLFCIVTVVIDLRLTKKIRNDIKQMRPLESRCEYFEKLPLQPGVAKEIRLFGMQTAILTQWKTALAPILGAKREREYQGEKQSFLISLIFYAFFSLIMVTAILQLRSGAILASTVVVIFNYGFQMFTALQALSKTIITADHGLFSLERQKALFESYTRDTAITQAADEGNHCNLIFDVRDVSYTYPNGKKAVNGLTFSVAEGDIVALVGENGSGKSTLINLLLGVLSPKTGRLYYNGQQYGSFDADILHDDIGVFFQECSFFHKTIRENVGFGDVNYIDDKERIRAALNQGDALSFVDKLPQKEETFVGKQIEKSGIEFSGGEKQRLGISRANMSNKKVLFFDEPSSMLDPLAELRQFDLIKNKLNGRTAILVSHRMGFAKDATKIIVLHQGRIVGCGDHKTLMVTCSQYRNMYEAQSKWYEEETVIEKT